MNQGLLTSVVGFFAGILAASLVLVGWSTVAFATLLAVVFGVFWFWKRQPIYFISCLCFVAVVFGMARTLLVPTELPEAFQPLIHTQVELIGVVVADPDLREETQRITIQIEREGEKTKVLAVAPLYPEISYGDTVRAYGLLEEPEPFAPTEGRVFRYDKFLAKDGVFAIMQKASLEVVASREGVSRHLFGFFSDIKQRGVQALALALPEPQASLAAGLLVGGKQGLGSSLLEDFIRSGLVHIVVLSGYNVMIVAEFVLRAFAFLPRRYASVFAALTITAFVFAAGAGAASVRAGIMASIALYGRASGKKYDALRALLFAAALMLLWNPLTLVYDPGFQLSFIATLGLIFGTPLVERWLLFVQNSFLRDMASATIAAQISVLPLLLYQNGLFSVVALPANLLVLPLVPFAMLFSALAGVAGLLLPAFAPVIALPAYALLSYMTWIVEKAASLPLAAFSLPAFPFWLTLVAYAGLWYVVYRFSKPTKPPLPLSAPQRHSS